MNDPKDKRLDELIDQLPESSSSASMDLVDEVLNLMSADEILVTTEGEDGTYILLPTEHALELFLWLDQKRVSCSMPREAIWLGDRPTDSVIELGPNVRPAAVEPHIDKWFFAIQFVPSKWKDPIDSADPEKIGWKYDTERYCSCVNDYRRRPENRFLRPG